MSYWCDDAKLNRVQRKLDAMQAEAKERMAAADRPSPLVERWAYLDRRDDEDRAILARNSRPQ